MVRSPLATSVHLSTNLRMHLSFHRHSRRERIADEWRHAAVALFASQKDQRSRGRVFCLSSTRRNPQDVDASQDSGSLSPSVLRSKSLKNRSRPVHLSVALDLSVSCLSLYPLLAFQERGGSICLSVSVSTVSLLCLWCFFAGVETLPSSHLRPSPASRKKESTAGMKVAAFVFSSSREAVRRRETRCKGRGWSLSKASSLHGEVFA